MMNSLQGYTIRREVKISGTKVRAFFRDKESTPVFSFSDLIRAVFGEDNPGVQVLSKQLPEGHRANLIGRSGNSMVVVDFEGLSFFLNDKMESKFAKTTIDYVKAFLDKESHKLPSPVKVVSKSDIREEKIDEEFKRQYMVQTEDGRPQRYLKIRGFRWFNGNDIRSNYCGSSDEYFNSIVENLKDEYRFKALMDEAGTITFLSEQGFIELLKETTPDSYKFVYENILEQCLENEKELDEEKEEFVIESKLEEPKEKPKALELSDVYKLRKNLKDSIRVSEFEIRRFATADYSFRLLRYNDTVFASVDDVQNSALNPENKEYKGSSTLKFASAENKDKYLGRFAKLYDVLNCFLDDEKLLEVLEKVKLFVNPPPIVKAKVKPEKEAGVEMNKYYTADPIPGRVVGWTDLQMNVPVFTVFIENKDKHFQPLFRANDIGDYAGFTNATTLARNKVDENLYTNVSIREIHRNNVRVLSLDGVRELIVASGKFDDDTIETLTNDLKAAATKYMLENANDMRFLVDKWNAEESIKEEDTVGEETKVEQEQEQEPQVTEEMKAEAGEAIQNAMQNPELMKKLNEAVPGGIGAIAAGLSSMLNQGNKKEENAQKEFPGTVFVNEKPVRAVIVKSPNGGITPYYCVEDFCAAWNLNTEAVVGHITESVPARFEKDENGNVSYVSYADLSAIAMLENKEARTMVSNTMKASASLFEEACRNFGIGFKNDTDGEKERVGHYADRMDDSLENVDTTKAGSMEKLLSHSENGHAYAIGAIILAERIRNVLMYLKVRKFTGEVGVPGPTTNSLVKKLWTFIDTQDPQVPASTAFQQTVVTANERYRCLLDAARSLQNE